MIEDALTCHDARLLPVAVPRLLCVQPQLNTSLSGDKSSWSVRRVTAARAAVGGPEARAVS
eukprot:1305891-Prymnesium_polylepis.1